MCNSGKTIDEAGAAKTEDKPGDGDKVVKRRKWGSQSSSSSQKPKKVTNMPISTDSLKVRASERDVVFIGTLCI